MLSLLNKKVVSLSISLYFFPAIAWSLDAGSKAPSCSLTNYSKTANVSLSKPGKVVYVDFWASWCGPCAQSMPFFNELQKDFADKGLEIIGVNVDEDKSEADRFIDHYKPTFTIASDHDNACAESFDVTVMPSSYLFDRNGNLHSVELGFHSQNKDGLRQKVEHLLNQ